MSWAQAILLARGASRGWGGICSTALTGAPFSQVPPQAPRGLRCSAAAHNPDSSLVPHPPEPPRRPVKALAVHEELFRPALDGARNKANFVRAVQNFTEYNVHKRGHVDFIYLALRKMREYGVERDLSVYNLLLDIFPKEVFRPRNIFHSIFLHYPRQQECGIAVCFLGMAFLFLEQSVAAPFSVTQPRSCRQWQRQDFHTGGLAPGFPPHEHLQGQWLWLNPPGVYGFSSLFPPRSASYLQLPLPPLVYSKV